VGGHFVCNHPVSEELIVILAQSAAQLLVRSSQHQHCDAPGRTRKSAINNLSPNGFLLKQRTDHKRSDSNKMYRNLVENPEGKSYLGDLVVDGKTL
jgi:hypothetical protein